MRVVLHCGIHFFAAVFKFYGNLIVVICFRLYYLSYKELKNKGRQGCIGVFCFKSKKLIVFLLQ